MKNIIIIILIICAITVFSVDLATPTQATLLSITDSSMVLKWQHIDYELGYIIERDTGGGWDSIGFTGAGDGIMTYDSTGMSGLTPDKMYRYRVYGYNADTVSDYAIDSMWTIKTIILSKADNSYQGGKDDGYAFYTTVPFALPTLPPPIISQATLLSITDTSMVLKWNDQTNYEDAFVIMRKTTFGWDSVGQMEPANGIITYDGDGMSGLTPDKMYRYRVWAYNNSDTVYAEDSMWTIKTIIANKAVNSYQGGKDDGYAFYTTVPFALPTLPPPIISQATLLSITDTSMVLKWNDQTNYEDGFTIMKKTTFGWSFIAEIGPGNGIMTYDSIGMSGLAPDKMHRYRVWAYNASDTVYAEDSMWTTRTILTKATNTYQGGKGSGYASGGVDETPTVFIQQIATFMGYEGDNCIDLNLFTGNGAFVKVDKRTDRTSSETMINTYCSGTLKFKDFSPIEGGNRYDAIIRYSNGKSVKIAIKVYYKPKTVKIQSMIGKLKFVSNGDFTVKVYNILGSEVKNINIKRQALEIPLASGIYFVHIIEKGKIIKSIVF